jgi:opacity protein-like surface antigen
MKSSKKMLHAFLALTLISTASFAQKGSSGNSVQQGTILIDATYGFPYVNGTLIKAAYSSDSLGGTGVARNYNHFGGRIEYMVSDKISLGMEGTYALATVDYRGSNLQTYRAGMSKLRILARMSYHFATNEHIDPYITWGVGYKNTKVYSNEPGDVREVSVNLLPISFRTGIGIRYFFTDGVGINVEAGIGGPAVQAGISFKL